MGWAPGGAPAPQTRPPGFGGPPAPLTHPLAHHGPFLLTCVHRDVQVDFSERINLLLREQIQQRQKTILDEVAMTTTSGVGLYTPPPTEIQWSGALQGSIRGVGRVFLCPPRAGSATPGFYSRRGMCLELGLF